MEVKEVSCGAWGNCLRLSNGILEAVVTIDYGPRILSFRLLEGENVMFDDKARSICLSGEEMEARYGPGAVFYRRGGHFCTVAPERFPESYFPDNSPVVYGIRPEGVSFTPPQGARDQVKLSFEIIMSEGASDIMVVHSLKNTSRERQKAAIWASTALRSGGVEVIPQNVVNVPVTAPNRILALWPGSSLLDSRLYPGERYLTVRQDPAVQKDLIFGVNNVTGWAAYVLPDTTLVKRYVHEEQACYPNHDCSYRTHVNGAFAQLESFSPLYVLEPGEGIRHVENLSLFRTREGINPVDEDSVEHFLQVLR